MHKRSRERLVYFLGTVVLVGLFSVAGIFLVRGYRIDLVDKKVNASGMLVATSDPNGAQVWVDGELNSATNNTILLRPGEYEVKLTKEGFLTWQKRLTIEKELVVKTEAILFPKVPSLSALTFDGAVNPVVSLDGTKLAYVVPLEESEKTGLWVMPFTDLPLGFSRDPRMVAKGDFNGAKTGWSPDSRQILIKTKTGVYYLLDAAKLNAPNEWKNVTATLAELSKTWEEEKQRLREAHMKNLPEEMQVIIREKSDFASWSPDETKVLYTATASGKIAKELVPPLPATSTQMEEREIKVGNTYVYDIKEDRNFRIAERPMVNITKAETKTKSVVKPAVKAEINYDEKFFKEAATISWFPSSLHVVLAEESKIVICDYDGTNYQTVYAGPFEKNWAVPYPNGTRMIILTNFNQESEEAANLYAISLK